MPDASWQIVATGADGRMVAAINRSNVQRIGDHRRVWVLFNEVHPYSDYGGQAHSYGTSSVSYFEYRCAERAYRVLQSTDFTDVATRGRAFPRATSAREQYVAPTSG
jgi:hypothetical protein